MSSSNVSSPCPKESAVRILSATCCFDLKVGQIIIEPECLFKTYLPSIKSKPNDRVNSISKLADDSVFVVVEQVSDSDRMVASLAISGYAFL